MDNRKQRCVYVTANQKKKLIELIAKNPQLISCKVKDGFAIRDSQRLWQEIAAECNAIPGARKNWMQWRKTWQDLRSNSKKRNAYSYRDSLTLTPAEREILGMNTSSLPLKCESPQEQEETEFIQLEEEFLQDDSCSEDMDYVQSNSESESIQEPKEPAQKRKVKNTNSKLKNTKHSQGYFNCDVLTTLEQKKLEVKEDYIKFKKDYLRQKLKLIKEQTEALKSIAKELSK